MTDVKEIYGNRLRVRVCGVLIEQEKLLMVNHRSLTRSDFWSPPGGGVDFGESVADALNREFFEETGLTIEIIEFLFVSEFLKDPLHAIELFFLVRRSGGSLTTGIDPELQADRQIIQQVDFLSWEQIRNVDPAMRHGIFRFTEDPQQIGRLKGYFKV